MTPLTLNVREAAALIGTSDAFVRRGVREGTIAAIRVGRLIRIPRNPLLQLLGGSPDHTEIRGEPESDDRERCCADDSQP